MSNANISILGDECLLEIFEHLPLLDQICAGDVCRRWRSLCQRFCRRVYKFSGNGVTWRFKDENRKNLIVTTNWEEVKSVLKSCSMFIEKFRLNILHRPMHPRELQLIVGIVAVRCGNLRVIYLRQIRDDMIPLLIPIMVLQNPNLMSLVMKEVYCLNLYNVVKHLPKRLIEFQFFNDQRTDSHALVHLLRSCQNLKSFGFNYVTDIVADFIGTQHHLTYLLAKYAFTIAPSFNQIVHLKNLVVLDVEKSIIEDENLVNIAHNCQQLYFLVITRCDKITDIGISSLANLKRLRELRMRELNKVTDASIAILPVSLQELYCCGCERILDNGVIQFITRAKHLKELRITRSQITNITIEAVIRIFRDHGRRRNLVIDAQNSKADIDTIDKTLTADLPSSLRLIF